MNRECRKCGATWKTGEACPACHTVVFPFAAVVHHGSAAVAYSHLELSAMCNRLERQGLHYSVFWASPYVTPQSTSDTTTAGKAEA